MEKLKELFNEKKMRYILTFTIIGILLHLELFVRQSSNPDTFSLGLYYIPGSWEVSLGRWFIVIVSMMRFGLSSAVFNSTISIILMVITSIFIIDLLEIKNKVNKIICTLIALTMPSFAVTLTYFYCSDAYVLAMLFSVLMPWFVFKFKNKKNISILLGAISITLSLALYQSYLGVSLSLCIMIAILKLINNEKNYTVKELLVDIGRCAITVIIGFLIYAIISQIFLVIYNVERPDYAGVSQISLIDSILDFPNFFKKSYKVFLNLLFKDSIVKNTIYGRGKYYNIVILCFFVLIIIKGIKSNNKLKAVISVILALLLPVAFNSILFIVIKRATNVLMSTPMLMFLIYFVAVIDKYKFNKSFLIPYVSLGIIIFTYIITMNATYITVDYIRSQTVETVKRIVTNIENLDGYKNETKLCMVRSNK